MNIDQISEEIGCFQALKIIEDFFFFKQRRKDWAVSRQKYLLYHRKKLTGEKNELTKG